MIDYFNISKQDKFIKKKILKDISKVISNNNFILGKPVDDFEKKFSKFSCNKVIKFATKFCGYITCNDLDIYIISRG